MLHYAIFQALCFAMPWRDKLHKHCPMQHTGTMQWPTTLRSKLHKLLGQVELSSSISNASCNLAIFQAMCSVSSVSQLVLQWFVAPANENVPLSLCDY